MNELRKCVEVLCAYASNGDVEAIDSLQYSQAACNVANAMAQLQNIELQKKRESSQT